MELWLCATSDVSEDNPTRIKSDGFDLIVLKNSMGTYYVADNMCSHARVKLHSGHWDSMTSEITCPAHKARFCVAQGGKPLCAPAVTPIQIHSCEIKQRNGEDWVVADVDDED